LGRKKCEEFNTKKKFEKKEKKIQEEHKKKLELKLAKNFAIRESMEKNLKKKEFF
jgi:hypothetical protein